jgi:hypothetical protein
LFHLAGLDFTTPSLLTAALNELPLRAQRLNLLDMHQLCFALTHFFARIHSLRHPVPHAALATCVLALNQRARALLQALPPKHKFVPEAAALVCFFSAHAPADCPHLHALLQTASQPLFSTAPKLPLRDLRNLVELFPKHAGLFSVDLVLEATRALAERVTKQAQKQSSGATDALLAAWQALRKLHVHDAACGDKALDILAAALRVRGPFLSFDHLLLALTLVQSSNKHSLTCTTLLRHLLEHLVLQAQSPLDQSTDPTRPQDPLCSLTPQLLQRLGELAQRNQTAAVVSRISSAHSHLRPLAAVPR